MSTFMDTLRNNPTQFSGAPGDVVVSGFNQSDNSHSKIKELFEVKAVY